MSDSDGKSEIAIRSWYRSFGALFSPWRPAALKNSWPGISIVIVISMAASFISATYGGPQLLYALFFGMAFHFLSQARNCRPGIEFCSKTLLRTGVALLGARITLNQIASLGLTTIAVVIFAVLLTILFGWALAKLLRRPPEEGLLSGGAVAICGASAALAISAVLPHSTENSRFTLLTVVGVTTLSTMAMVLYPIFVKALNLDATAAGIFIGASIHDVAQVVGAGYLISGQAGDVATVVKLTRVACLVPLVLGLSILFHTGRSRTERSTRSVVPFFLIGFACVMSANSLDLISEKAAELISTISRACLVMAISALGVKTSLQSLTSLGWQPVMLLLVETIWLATFILLALAFLG